MTTENAVIGDAVTIDSSYVSLAARCSRSTDPSPLAALIAAVTKGVIHAATSSVLMLPGFSAGLIAVGSSGNTVDETAYILRRVDFGSTGSYVLEPIYTATWTLSATAVAAAAGSLGATFQECSAVSVTSTFLLEGRVGTGPVASTGQPVTIEVPDLGPGVEAIVRIFKSATVTSIRPISTKWK